MKKIPPPPMKPLIKECCFDEEKYFVYGIVKLSCIASQKFK